MSKYRLSQNVRKYSSTPIVRPYLDDNGKEKEEMICVCIGKKKEADAMATKIVAFLNAEEKRASTDVEDIINHGATTF